MVRALCFYAFIKPLFGSKVKAGDVLIGVSSSGAHSNGYSLLRKILDVKNVDLTQIVDGRPLADVAMEPTRIYVKPILQLLKEVDVHAMAHITGGGLPGNLPRVLPNGAQAVVNEASWEWPELFKLLQREGGVEQFEMYRTFNCEIRACLCLKRKNCNGKSTMTKISAG
jgi:phosphoribosylformylglycinamidine cyclo-ligase